jgi:hypothetical protein
MATSDSLIDVSDGHVRVVFHSEASELSVAVRSPVIARLSYDAGGWGTTGNPWNLFVNSQPSGVIEYSGESDGRRILNFSLDNGLVPGTRWNWSERCGPTAAAAFSFSAGRRSSLTPTTPGRGAACTTSSTRPGRSTISWSD